MSASYKLSMKGRLYVPERQIVANVFYGVFKRGQLSILRSAAFDKFNAGHLFLLPDPELHIFRNISDNRYVLIVQDLLQ